MRIISRKILREFWEKHPDSRQQLQAWYIDVKHANWTSPTDIKETYPHASILVDDRVVFNIKGNKYRMIVIIQYRFGQVYIRLLVRIRNMIVSMPKRFRRI